MAEGVSDSPVALLKTVAGGPGGLQGLAVFARSGSQRAVLLPC